VTDADKLGLADKKCRLNITICSLACAEALFKMDPALADKKKDCMGVLILRIDGLQVGFYYDIHFQKRLVQHIQDTKATLWEKFLWAEEVIYKGHKASQWIECEDPRPWNTSVYWVKSTTKGEAPNEMLRGLEARGFLE
jgi:hypothetical protein